LACPAKYYWTYIDDRGKWYFRSRSAFSFGSSLHRVLQRFHDSGDVDVTSIEQATAALEEDWIDAGYSSQQEMHEALGEGKEIVTAYLTHSAELAPGSSTIYLEHTLREELGAFVLLGRVDRVDEHPDGSLEIIDYKSGRLAVSSEDIRQSVPMGCYQLLLRARFPDRRVFSTIIALRTGDRASHEWTEVELEEFRADVVSLGEEILNRDFEALTPLGKALCHDCEFQPLCRKHPDFVLPTEEN